ncbi:MAG: NVEALA domain-containing protein [Tannerella sp.]|jgi:hypothetical protein|nr:NVEALA domain-containing protein [Tannerella sp.]
MKKYLYSIAVLVIVSVSIANVNVGLRSNNLSDVFLANVEVLALAEGGSQPMDCYAGIEYVNDGRPVETQTYCGDCQSIQCTHWWNPGRCMR